jgi:5'-nucleotidase
MVDYFEANPVVSPEYEQRSVGVALSAPDADGYSAGDQVTLSLSSLLFSNGEPNAGTAVVSAGAVQLGSAAIDPAIVDTTDEVGRASVAITIPAGTPAGALVLTVSVPETGTTVDVPITVTSNLEPITVLKDPRITGSEKVGKTLSVNEGRWSVAHPNFAYQWNRDGVPIEGATLDHYRLVAADAGTDITVTVTASKAGFASGVATTAAVAVHPLDTHTRGTLSRHLASSSSTVSYSVRVVADENPAPIGQVTIYDGSHAIATVELVASDHGRVVVPISGLARGVHQITARFVGDDQFSTSHSLPDLLLLY